MTYENHISLMCSSHRRTALIGMQFSQDIYLIDAQLSQACSSHRAFSDFEKKKVFMQGSLFPIVDSANLSSAMTLEGEIDRRNIKNAISSSVGRR
jgi:hypothetical protein